jgi:hypothetical protein
MISQRKGKPEEADASFLSTQVLFFGRSSAKGFDYGARDRGANPTYTLTTKSSVLTELPFLSYLSSKAHSLYRIIKIMHAAKLITLHLSLKIESHSWQTYLFHRDRRLMAETYHHKPFSLSEPE